MNRSKILNSFLIFWILGWVYVGIEQVQISIDYRLSQQDKESIYQPGYTVVNRNGNKFLIKDTENLVEDIPAIEDEQCFVNEMLAQMHHKFSYENNQLHLSFGENTPEDYGIHKLSLQIEPDWQYAKKSDVLHNIYTLDLPANQNEISLPINIYQTKNKFDISITLKGSGKTNYQRDCLTSKITKVETNSIKNFSVINPYFSKKTIKSVYMNVPNITANTEDIYIHEYMLYQQKRLSHKTLPPPHEAAVALLRKDIIKNTESDSWEWKDIKYGIPHKRNQETVIGFYGEVRNSDLVLLSNLIDALAIVIPDLNIKYSNNHSEVNLPIHIYPCTKEIDYQLGCKDEYAGAYFGSDWIFIDGNNSKEYRKHIIVHELGHALGLGHNLCPDSVMSYADYSTDPLFFSHIDLMQLQVLYSGKANIVSGNNLDEEKIEYYQENINQACSIKNSGWLELINLQLGTG